MIFWGGRLRRNVSVRRQTEDKKASGLFALEQKVFYFNRKERHDIHDLNSVIGF